MEIINSLDNILEYCVNYVPFYKNCKKDGNYKYNIRQFPLIRKKDILITPQNFISDKYNIEKLLKEYTSGSTGVPLIIYKSFGDKILAGKQLWELRETQYGINPKAFYCKFHMDASKGNEEVRSERVIIKNNFISLSLLHLNDEDLEMYYELLKSYKVRWIFGVPSAIYMIAKFILKNKKESLVDLKYVELSGEYCTKSMREEMKQIFNCNIGELYGMREVYGIAARCKNGNMHCLDKNVYIETLNKFNKSINKNEKEGNFYITSLNNYAMPFVRYETGDRGKILTEHNCNCGIKSNLIEITGGRKTEYVYFDNYRINSCIFYLAISEINIIYDNIVIQFKVLQRKDDTFLLIFNIRNEKILFKDEIEKCFLRLLDKLGMPKKHWEFNYVDIIEKGKKNKLEIFEKEI